MVWEPHIPILLGLLIIWISTTIQYSEQNTFQRLGLFPSSAVQSNKQSCSQSLNPHCMYQNHTRQMTNATAQTKLILHCLSLSHLTTVLQSTLQLHVSNSYNRKDRGPKKVLQIWRKNEDNSKLKGDNLQTAQFWKYKTAVFMCKFPLMCNDNDSQCYSNSLASS